MYWSYVYKNKRYMSWGKPAAIPKHETYELRPRFDVKVYGGEKIKRGDSIVFAVQGTDNLGLGDTIWMLSYIRDIYRIKARRKCKRFVVVSSPTMLKFFSNFLPRSFEMYPEYMQEDEFMSMDHKLPSVYFWSSRYDKADRSWIDNQSLLHRLYNWSGMEYRGLPDWSEFTNEDILYPNNSFWEGIGIEKGEPYVFFQWHSSGHSKNLPPFSNLKIILHILEKYKIKVCVIGRLRCLDKELSNIPGVINLSGKTEGRPQDLFTLASNSSFIVCPDSAGVHLSEAYHVPCVCIMSTLPPSYIADKYQIPSFMFGSGACPYSPCGIVHELPKKTKCPEGTKNYCKVLEDIDLNLFDRCLESSFDKLNRYRSSTPSPFYSALSEPISMQ